MELTKDTRNPFVNRSMIKNPGEFFGRRNEVKSIMDRTSKMQCSSVVGERRIGKSSLLYYIFKTYEKYIGSEFKVIYIDLQRAKTHTSAGFLSEILKKFGAESSIINENASLLKNLCNFEEAIEELNGKIKPVVCFDEFENITRRTDEFTDDFFESLRSLANSSKIAYITATQKSLSELSREGKLTSPFHNIFTSVNLGRFSPGESNKFVNSSRSPVKFTDEEVEFILNLGNDHPLYLEIAQYYVLEAKLNMLRFFGKHCATAVAKFPRILGNRDIFYRTLGTIKNGNIDKEENKDEIRYAVKKEIEQCSRSASLIRHSLDDVELYDRLGTSGTATVFLLFGKATNYQTVVLNSLEIMVNKKNMGGIYLSAGKPYEVISKSIKDKGIKTENLWFIDTISGKMGEEERCIFVDNPAGLEFISVQIDNLIQRLKSNNKFLFIDDLSSLLMNNDLKSIEEFSIKILNWLQLNNITGIIATIEEKTPTELIDRIVTRCDDVISVNFSKDKRL